MLDGSESCGLDEKDETHTARAGVRIIRARVYAGKDGSSYGATSVNLITSASHHLVIRKIQPE